MARYLRQPDDAEQAALDAAELRLRAERRLGELLAETIVQGSHNTKLPEGIAPIQSSRYQQAARVPEHQFEVLVSKAREKRDAGQLTSAAVRRLAKEARGVDRPTGRLTCCLSPATG